MDIKNVNRVKGGNRFCGPAAISAVTGCTTDEAARVLRSINGKRAITSVGARDMRLAYSHFGVRMELLHNYPKKDERPTLASWLRDHSSIRTAGRVFLVCAGNHWQLVSGRRFVCGQISEVVGLTHAKVRRRARVAYVHELSISTGINKAPAASQPPSLTAAHKKAKSASDSARRKAKALADQYDIEIEKPRDNDLIWIYPPSGVFSEDGGNEAGETEDGRPVDPYHDEHYCLEWSEALDRVETYVKYLKQYVIEDEPA